MADNNMMILVGLGAVAFWFMNRGGSEEDQVDQLAGAAMMAAGEGTAPDAPFQAYSAPSNPVFFFNESGQMGRVPGTNVPFAASSGEDIGVYPGRYNRPELEFTVAKSIAAGTSDESPGTPEFQAPKLTAPIVPASIWDEQSFIASSNFMPLLAIQTGGGGVDILGSNVDISNLSSKEYFRGGGSFRAINVDDPTGDITGGFTTTAAVLGEYVRGFTGTPAAPSTGGVVVSQTAPSAAWIERQEWDLDIGF
jgi:hypothetical protein